MPLTVEPLVVRRALTAVGAADPEAGRDVEHVLDVLGGREHATRPLELSRHGVQLFLWYRLPRKYLAPLEHKHALRVALARFFDALGDSAAGYAALCRSADTAACSTPTSATRRAGTSSCAA